MKNTLSLLLIVLIFSCSNNKPQTKASVSSSFIKRNDFVIDTVFSPENHKSVKHWSDASDYYGVYHFAKKITGIGFDDSWPLHSSFKLDDGVLVDTTGNYSIRYSKKLSDFVLNNDTSKIFYIYCTRGTTKATIDKVLYGTTDCTDVLILQLSKIDTLQFGQPVIASKKLFDLTYKTNQKFQNGLARYEAIMKKKADYTDSIPSRQFAYNSKLFFAYSDDFEWFESNEDRKCLFPSRTVYRIVGNSAKAEWADDLDLFGIPCD
jgi:hypothetical protein